tara:strand:+ start:14 stop:430 length:417 start_codon:yes stop_codon:yes gene_type:complete
MIRINNKIIINESEISETFTRSSGPGGQHVNKVATKVELRFQASKSVNLTISVKKRLQVIAGVKWNKNGEICITAEKFRSQLMNRNLARDKLIKIILLALEQPVYRLKTKPNKAVEVRRKRQKIKRSEIKVLRSRIKI